MNIKPLKFVLIVENIICVHRNRTKHGSVIRLLINSHIFCVLSLTAANSILKLDSSKFHVNALYFYGNTVCSTVLILLSCYHSKFNVLLEYLTTNHAYVKNESEYLKKLAKCNKITIFVSTGFFVYFLSYFVYFDNFQDLVVPYKERLITYLLYANTLTCSFRYTFEHIVIYSILVVLSEQLKCVTRYVDSVEVDGRETGSAIGNGWNYQEKLKEFDSWCKTYANIKESSKLINAIFGLQLTYMIATMVFYFIIFLYSVTSMGVAGQLATSRLYFLFTTITILLIPLTMVSRAAQHTQDSADVLRQKLGKLLIHSLRNADLYKATKDFLRFVSTRPIRTQAFGSICVDMSLLPACVLFFTYYTVIALQFNNVV